MRGFLGALALAGAMIAASPTVLAQQSWSGFYAGLLGIGAFHARMDDFSSDGFAAHDVENDWDTVAGVGGFVGYAWPNLPIRTELEIAHRFRFDLDVRDRTGAGTIDYESNVETTTVALNLLLEWRNSSRLTPFVGGTVGYGHNRTETTRTDLATGTTSKESAGKDNLIWGALVGVDWAFADRWSAAAAYRYLDLGEVRAGGFATGESYEAESYESHELLLSVLHRF